MFYVNIDGVDYPSDNLPPNSTNKETIERRERRKRSKRMSTWTSFTGEQMEYTVQPKNFNKSLSELNFCLAPLKQPPAPQATVPSGWIKGRMASIIIDDVIKEEGKTPMRYNDNYATACAHVTTVQSDTATQRDYLLGRLEKADWPKQQELQNLFNLYVNNTPKTFKELIDAIKNGKYTIDPKVEKKLAAADDTDEDGGYYWGPLHGIIWEGPQTDMDGFDEAMKQKAVQYTAAKDAIMSGVYADGLKALQDFEAWLPTPVTVH